MRNFFLKSARLRFGIWDEHDLPLALGLWGDADVTLLTGGPFTDVQVQERLAREINNHAQFRMQYWPIFLLSNGDHVGCCGLRPHKPRDGIYELGYH